MIDFTLKEKNIIRDALTYAKKTIADSDPGHLEFIDDIQEDIFKTNILLSRTQIDVIVYYLNNFICVIPHDKDEIAILQHKLNAFSDLP
ncbi:hypothetical protein [Chryseobacterium oranimense]|uniref:hypothetical protein n=1 Tax=Chryseobacterium oranimense TaxID=421058 RepID=UPI0031D5842D